MELWVTVTHHIIARSPGVHFDGKDLRSWLILRCRSGARWKVAGIIDPEKQFLRVILESDVLSSFDLAAKDRFGLSVHSLRVRDQRAFPHAIGSDTLRAESLDLFDRSRPIDGAFGIAFPGIENHDGLPANSQGNQGDPLAVGSAFEFCMRKRFPSLIKGHPESNRANAPGGDLIGKDRIRTGRCWRG